MMAHQPRDIRIVLNYKYAWFHTAIVSVSRALLQPCADQCAQSAAPQLRLLKFDENFHAINDLTRHWQPRPLRQEALPHEPVQSTVIPNHPSKPLSFRTRCLLK